MAITQYTEPATVNPDLTDWQNSIARDNASSRGFAEVDLSSYADGATAPTVAVGSRFDNNGALYVVSGTAESISGIAGIANSTTFYVYYDVSAGVFLASTTAPTFDKEKRGWYNGADRALFRVFKDSGGEYDDRIKLGDVGDRKLVKRFFPAGSYSWTAPVGVGKIIVTACGAGGGGGDAGATSNDNAGGGGSSTVTSTGIIDMLAPGGRNGNGTTSVSGQGFAGMTYTSVAQFLTNTGQDYTNFDYVIVGQSGAMGLETAAGGVGGQGGGSYFGGGNVNPRAPGTAFAGSVGNGYGAGGSGAQSATQGAGGGGGGYTLVKHYYAQPGEVFTITVGAGGAGANGTNDGGDGEDGIVLIEY